MSLLDIKDLRVSIEGKVILDDFNLTIGTGELHVLFGSNGSGKTTLVNTIMGTGGYKVEKGSIKFRGEDIVHMKTDERVKRGIACLIQNPPEIHGVKFDKLLSIILKRKNPQFNEEQIANKINELYTTLNFNRDFGTRDVNRGFSGGERKRAELMQILAMEPDLILFDEPDSGVDIENVELMGNTIRKLLQQDMIPRVQKRSGLIITHTAYILKYVGRITKAHVMVHGKIVCEGNPERIQRTIEEEGFDGCINCMNKSTEESAVCLDLERKTNA
jgi:Fe-S cluster assembly ATP-binding protein